MHFLRQDGMEGFSAEGACFAFVLVHLQVSLQAIGRVQALPTVTTARVWVAGTGVQDVFE